jgi:hypothetical protein
LSSRAKAGSLWCAIRPEAALRCSTPPLTADPQHSAAFTYRFPQIFVFPLTLFCLTFALMSTLLVMSSLCLSFSLFTFVSVVHSCFVGDARSWMPNVWSPPNLSTVVLVCAQSSCKATPRKSHGKDLAKFDCPIFRVAANLRPLLYHHGEMFAT